MKFNNVVAWAKGWYQERENVTAWWMDLIHCINNDGWCLQTKQDVVNWILNRFDAEPEFFKKDYGCFGFADMYQRINRDKWLYKDEAELSTEDCIILYFRSCLQCKSKEHFEEGGYRPSNFVLPLTLHSAYYSDGYWNNGIPEWKPAEMMCDALKRVDEMFPNLPEQKERHWLYNDEENFDKIEEAICGKNWKDVRVLCGRECGCEKFLVSGSYLNKRESVKSGLTDEYGDVIYFDMGIYSNSIGFDENKTYYLYVQTIITHDIWGDETERIVRKIEEV